MTYRIADEVSWRKVLRNRLCSSIDSESDSEKVGEGVCDLCDVAGELVVDLGTGGCGRTEVRDRFGQRGVDGGSGTNSREGLAGGERNGTDLAPVESCGDGAPEGMGGQECVCGGVESHGGRRRVDEGREKGEKSRVKQQN